MASYTVPIATATWQTLTAPTKDAWLLSMTHGIYISDDASPSKLTAGFVPAQVPYSVPTGKVFKVASASHWDTPLRMWDKA